MPTVALELPRLACAGVLFTVGLLAAACSSRPLDSAEGGGDSAAQRVPSEVELIALYEPPAAWSATALAFDPQRSGELWVTLRRFPSSKPCLSNATAGCAALEGQVALVQHAGSSTPELTLKKDGNAWHFMRRPTSIAFGDNGNLATCGEARTDNFEDETIDYSGPVLWSSDPQIFGVPPKPGQNGTHLDMLHDSPYCMGIAHERENAYWVFNGQLGALDRYDFHHPHVIGGEDHSDGELSRYLEGELVRVPEVPSQLAFDRERRALYIVDTSQGRILRLATDSGTPGADVPANDPIAVHRRIDDAVVEELVPPGVLSRPSGIALWGTVVLVTDNATGRIFWFSREGEALGSVSTGLAPGALSGIAVGPDQHLYVSDLQSGAAYRVLGH